MNRTSPQVGRRFWVGSATAAFVVLLTACTSTPVAAPTAAPLTPSTTARPAALPAAPPPAPPARMAAAAESTPPAPVARPAKPADKPADKPAQAPPTTSLTAAGSASANVAPKREASAAAAAPPRTAQVAAAPATATGPATAAAPATSATPSTTPSTTPAAALDIKSLESRLKATSGIGVFTKITLKNQVDELLGQFRSFYKGELAATLAQLRQSYDQLVLKVLALLQDADPPLAGAIAASRESIWGILSDRKKFATV
jgi:hypothetical protein